MIESYCHFLGRIPDEELPAMYAACDAFVLPTAQLECFGLIMLEALASGRPVLATPVGAIPEVLGRIEPKWLADDQTERALTRLLCSFLTGQLPSHPPEQLRATVCQKYEKTDQLMRMASFVIS
jgi:glycosyltransferase involved in cell wall biosynthesis